MVVGLLCRILVVHVLAVQPDIIHRVLDRPHATVDRIFAHADDVSQAPTENLPALGVGDGAGHERLDGEHFNHASARSLRRGGRVNVRRRADRHQQGVGAELGCHESARGVRPIVLHVRDQRLPRPDRASRDIVRIRSDLLQVRHEDGLSISAQGNTMVGLVVGR